MYGQMEIRLHTFLNTKLDKINSKNYDLVADWEKGCRYSLNRTPSGRQKGSRHFGVKKKYISERQSKLDSLLLCPYCSHYSD